MMLSDNIKEKLIQDEFEGEKLINKFRFAAALLYAGVVILFAVLRNVEGLEPFPSYGFIPSNIFLLFSIIIFIYLKFKKSVHKSFKYICVVLDMTIISVSIYVGCGYPHLDPPISYLSIWALFYSVLIILGAFRYSVKCAFFSGIYAGICYLLVVIIRADSLDLKYFLILNGNEINVSFPTINESFRVISMIVTGSITAMACKRHLKLFSTMIETQSNVSKTTKVTLAQTQEMADTIRKSTDDIFLSSKDIFINANNQAASIQEIESTFTENMQIAADIADKTAGVASISAKMENDVTSGFSILERNVGQLDEIKNKNNGVISGILELSQKILKIREIIESINAITDQTKVIAFNAALEAASAGEYGKRFSIVASEVNRLADDITALTKDIRKQADDIQNSSSSLILSGKESSLRINEGNNLIKELHGIFGEIHRGAEITANEAQTITVSSQKQQKSITQINIAVAHISNGLSSFLNSTKAVTSSAESLSEMIKELGSFLDYKTVIREDL